MKLLVLTNLFPPHQTGGIELQCERVVEQLRQRGHVIRVLTSNHGLQTEQRDAEIERRLWLNGVFGHAERNSRGSVKAVELRNHAMLREAIEGFQPELIYVWSLSGLSKSLVLALANARIPVVFAVADNWLADEVRTDPWLRWWNQTNGSGGQRFFRALLELSGQRARLDRVAPTRLARGFDRVPALYGPPEKLAAVEPNSIGAFRFDRIYFATRALKDKAEQAGFRVAHGEVIYPGIATQLYFGEVKPVSTPLLRLLLVNKLDEESGALTALEALKQARANGVVCKLSLYGRGESDYVAQLRSFVVRHQLPTEFQTFSDPARDLPGAFRQHDAYLHTVEWDEPFNPTPLEAMACGLPVIVSRTGAVREVVRPGENGMCYTPGNATDLAARLQELQQHPDLRVQIAQAGQNEVIQRFNESAVLDQIEGYLQASLEAAAS